MFPFRRQSKSHQLNVFVRTSSAQSLLGPCFQRSRGALPWHMGKTSFLGLRRQRVSTSYRLTTRQENKHTVPAKTICLRPIQAVCSFIRQNFAQPAGNLHRHQILSGILKSVAVGVAVAETPYWMSSIIAISKTLYRRKLIRMARKQPRIRKVISVARMMREVRQFTFSSLAFAAFSVFVVWDIWHLSHDEPADVEIQKTVREDPVAALSNARKELARMMKEKKSR